jgi:hypothetical protein
LFLAVGLAVLGAASIDAGGPAAVETRAPGIYLEPARDQGEGAPLVKLESTAMARAGAKDIGKSIAGAMLTGGLLGKPKMAMMYAGSRAGLRVSSQPIFQFHLDPNAGSAAHPRQAPDPAAMMAVAMSGQPGQPGQLSPSDPSEMPLGATLQDFALVRLNTKDEERELVAEMGMKPKKVIPCRSRQLGPQVFRVAPEKPLEPGEYGFFAVPRNDGAGGGSDKLWGFGVDAR